MKLCGVLTNIGLGFNCCDSPVKSYASKKWASESEVKLSRHVTH